MEHRAGDPSENEASERLRRAEERYHKLVDAVSDYAIFLLDAGGHIATWNAGAEKTKGYTEAEIVGRHFSIFYTPEDRAVGKPENILRAVHATGRYEEEGWRVRKDGTRFWANVIITALHDESGAVIGLAKVTRDLTARRRANEELRLSEERFRLLVECVSDVALYMLDPNGIVSTWNTGAQRMKGYTADEIRGKPFTTFFLEEDVKAKTPELELARAREVGRYEGEGWRVRKDGTRFWASVVVTALRNESGDLVGFGKVTRDLTHQRQAEENERNLLREQIARATAQKTARALEEANRVKDEFLATVSHELRTPLNAILGWAKLMTKGVTAEALAKGIEVIRRNAEAQARIIDDILDVSRIVTGKLRLDIQSADLGALARDAVDVVRPSADAKRVTLDLIAPQVLVAGDPERLRQVIWNLLSNAVRFTDAGGVITLRASTEGTNAVLIVEDTGHGIEPDFLPFVFDRFQQADSSTTRRHGGLGLGLAIVRHIVELHGGSVRAESEGPGRGARFTVSLPIRALAEAPPSAHA